MFRYNQNAERQQSRVELELLGVRKGSLGIAVMVTTFVVAMTAIPNEKVFIGIVNGKYHR